MKAFLFTTATVLLTALLTSCVVPPYSLPPYAGSLDKCLSIYGTYEEYGLNADAGRMTPFFSYGFPDAFRVLEGRPLMNTAEGKSLGNWVRIKRIDEQTINIQLFNEAGSERNMDFDMRERNTGMSCNEKAWSISKSYLKLGEGPDSRTITYTELTKNGEDLSMKYEFQHWGGFFAMFMYKKSSSEGSILYRRVDLTIDDIHANNEKAKKAIAQYQDLMRLRSELLELNRARREEMRKK